MKTHRVSVTVEKDSIRVDPETLTMTSKDEIHWAGSNARKFSIVFDQASPFEHRELSHDLATAKRTPRTKGRFKYTVVSAENPGLKLDPIIIVEEPPTKGTP